METKWRETHGITCNRGPQQTCTAQGNFKMSSILSTKALEIKSSKTAVFNAYHI